MEGDDRTFRANFTSEGVARLREGVKVKLKEFMGDYTDDTLVEYVIVLLKNGRSKDEAKSELNVFLGDDSDSFASWLWDHLGANLSSYVEQRELHPDGSPRIKSAAEQQDGRTESHQIESDAGKERKTSGKRRNREWKGLIRDGNENENPLPQSSIPDNINLEDEPHQRVGHRKRSLSPWPTVEKTRRRHEQRRSGKREVSQTSVSTPRRLLQFAVRDAVATSRPSNSTAEPSFMRLRSVVSTSTGNSFLNEHLLRNQPVLELRTAIKAVAEAVKDVNKTRPSRNVFDRLGCAADVTNSTSHLEEYRSLADDGIGGDFTGEGVDPDLAYRRQNGDYMQQEGNVLSFHDGSNMSSDLAYDGEGYDDADVMSQGATDIYHPGTSSGDWVEDSLMFKYSSTHDADERVRRPHEELDQPAALPSASFKIASSVNMSTRKPQYQDVREVSEMDNHKLIQDSDTVVAKSQVWLMRENSNPKVPSNGNAKPEIGPQHESQKTQTRTDLCSTGRPTEDADSRTIFVSNVIPVHFAATKDSLSRHFNEFGEVLKVIILTDPLTGQPKGSACIEFMRKEAAEKALSLDGTSFMSRILKIVRKSSAQPDAASASVMAWPRIAQASPSAVPRFGRGPFARGIPSLYRPRIPIKPSARSFQWKRETQATVTEASGLALNSIVPPPPVRSLTYIRIEPKTEVKSSNESSGTA